MLPSETLPPLPPVPFNAAMHYFLASSAMDPLVHLLQHSTRKQNTSNQPNDVRVMPRVGCDV
jgi:hypothetical protein